MEHDLIVPDAPSFAYQIHEIFLGECYKFISVNQAPLIYDCGSNIGVSILYFKSLFPNTTIKAFEADEKIYTILAHNIQHLHGVTVTQKAVWINNETHSFNSEGADGGSLVNQSETTQKVQAIRLKDLLSQEKEIDFLRLDIEGAEVAVLEDCTDNLSVIKNLFIEYHSLVNEEQKLDVLLSTLTHAEFRYHMETASHQDNVFLSPKAWYNMDLQLNIFAYRV